MPEHRFAIRLATRQDACILPEIERDAAGRLAEIGLNDLVGHDLPAHVYLDAIAAGRCWIAEAENGIPIGSLATEIVDGNPHISGVSVRWVHQGRGVGRALIATSLEWARYHGHREVTLTTFRDVPFNGPFYVSLGFREIEVDEGRPQLSTLRRQEQALEKIAPRTTMGLRL